MSTLPLIIFPLPLFPLLLLQPHLSPLSLPLPPEYTRESLMLQKVSPDPTLLDDPTDTTTTPTPGPVPQPTDTRSPTTQTAITTVTTR